jgi:imidazolonepropionase-like amidohydrolase
VTADQTVSYEEMKAVVDMVHAAGHKVAIHSYGPAATRDAIRAGCDTLEHATDLDDDTIAEMVRKKVFYVPTIDHNQYYIENADSVYKYPELREMPKRLHPYTEQAREFKIVLLMFLKKCDP